MNTIALSVLALVLASSAADAAPKTDSRICGLLEGQFKADYVKLQSKFSAHRATAQRRRDRAAAIADIINRQYIDKIDDLDIVIAKGAGSLPDGAKLMKEAQDRRTQAAYDLRDKRNPDGTGKVEWAGCPSEKEWYRSSNKSIEYPYLHYCENSSGEGVFVSDGLRVYVKYNLINTDPSKGRILNANGQGVLFVCAGPSGRGADSDEEVCGVVDLLPKSKAHLTPESVLAPLVLEGRMQLLGTNEMRPYSKRINYFRKENYPSETEYMNERLLKNDCEALPVVGQGGSPGSPAAGTAGSEKGSLPSDGGGGTLVPGGIAVDPAN